LLKILQKRLQKRFLCFLFSSLKHLIIQGNSWEFLSKNVIFGELIRVEEDTFSDEALQ
jgi:hypothetical protein